MAEKTFNVKVTMEERWIDDFCSMLNWMQCCGDIGHSSLVGFFADGDGDFHPKFEIDTEYKRTKGYRNDDILQNPEVLFDAG